jgi:hypothetical protein
MYMIEGRADAYYKQFIDNFIIYQSLFENSGSINDILETPYPLYIDIILAQVEEEKRKRKHLKELEVKRNAERRQQNSKKIRP